MFSAVYGGKFHLENETITEGKIAYFTEFVNERLEALTGCCT